MTSTFGDHVTVCENVKTWFVLDVGHWSFEDASGQTEMKKHELEEQQMDGSCSAGSDKQCKIKWCGWRNTTGLGKLVGMQEE